MTPKSTLKMLSLALLATLSLFSFSSFPEGHLSRKTSASLRPPHASWRGSPPFMWPRAATVFREKYPPSKNQEASNNDREKIINKDFNDKLIVESAPEGANVMEKAAWRVSRQLTGRDFYRPVNYMFFRQAVKEIGLIPAIFATADRVLRDSKIGTYDVRIDAEHPVVNEGPEAYAPGRAGK